MYKLLYTKEARSNILKLGPALLASLKRCIERIASDPAVGKRLTHELSDFMSYRSGDYRIIYQVRRQELIVIIVALGHRKDIYKKLSRKTPSS